MAEWFYTRGGVQHGPVDAAELKRLQASGAIDADTLVWTHALGGNWVRLGETDILHPGPAGPPAQSSPALPREGLGSGGPVYGAPIAGSESFLTSDLTRAILGPRADSYLAKWQRMLDKAGGDIAVAGRSMSWNWPAFLLTFAWPFYRKLWTFGFVILAILLVLVVIPDAYDGIARAAGIGISTVCAMMANGIYLRSVHRMWTQLSAMPDRQQALALAAKQGGTSWPAAIGATFGLLVLSLLLALGTGVRDLFVSSVDCSTTTATDLVQQIARGQLSQDRHATRGIDATSTRLSLSSIRALSGDARRSECAASLRYDVRLRPGAPTGSDAAALGNTLNTDITYTVELQDGDRILVSVDGLK